MASYVTPLKSHQLPVPSPQLMLIHRSFGEWAMINRRNTASTIPHRFVNYYYHYSYSIFQSEKRNRNIYIYIYKYIPASCWKNLDAVRRGLSLLPSVSDGAKLLPATGGPVAPDLEAGPTRGKKGGSKRGQRIPFKNLFQESFPRIFVKNLCQESLSRILEEF